MAKTKQTIIKETVKNMKELGTYKPQFDQLIHIYAEIVLQYLKAVKDFEDSGQLYETETAAGNPKKSGIVSAMESLRKDILQYSDRLCLNPRSLENVTAESGTKSTLATVLSELSGR